MSHQVLALKWRPRNFSEVVGQPHVVTALTNGLENNRLHHAFLFTGTRGVGKTTLARIFAKSLNCEKGVSATPCGECSICKEVDSGRFVDLIEIDAASRTRVEDTRDILDNVQYAPTRGRYKIYLIDEVHMLSNSSFNALLKTLEEPPAHVKFLLATTDPQKLPITVLSRCLRFQLKKISEEEIKAQLAYLLGEEKISYDEQALQLIAQAGEGSMRDALSILDQAIAYTAEDITYEKTKEMLGIIDDQYILMLLNALVTKEVSEVLQATKNLAQIGLDYNRMLESLIKAFHELTLLQIDPNYTRRELEDRDAYTQLANQFSAEDLQLYYQVALHGRRDLGLHPNAEVGFEMTLIRMLLFTPNATSNPASKKKVSNGRAPKKRVDNQSLPEESSDNTSKITQLSSIAATIDQRQSVNRDSVDSKASVPKSDLIKSEDDREENRDNTMDLEQSESINESPPAIAYSNEMESEKPLRDDLFFNQLSAESASDFSCSADINNSDYVPLASTHDDHSELVIDQESIHAQSSADLVSAESTDAIEYVEDNDNVLEVNENPLPDALYGGELASNEEWLEIVDALPLETMMRGIAFSLVFKSFDQSHLILSRSEENRSFNVSEAEEKLAEAVSTLFGEPIRCTIEYVATSQLEEETFHERSERLERERLETAKTSLIADPIVRYLEDECGATMLERTIRLT